MLGEIWHLSAELCRVWACLPSLLMTPSLFSHPAGETSEQSGSDEDVASWISWFCSLKGNEFFCGE